MDLVALVAAFSTHWAVQVAAALVGAATGGVVCGLVKVPVRVSSIPT